MARVGPTHAGEPPAPNWRASDRRVRAARARRPPRETHAHRRQGGLDEIALRGRPDRERVAAFGSAVRTPLLPTSRVGGTGKALKLEFYITATHSSAPGRRECATACINAFMGRGRSRHERCAQDQGNEQQDAQGPLQRPIAGMLVAVLSRGGLRVAPALCTRWLAQQASGRPGDAAGEVRTTRRPQSRLSARSLTPRAHARLRAKASAIWLGLVVGALPG